MGCSTRSPAYRRRPPRIHCLEFRRKRRLDTLPLDEEIALVSQDWRHDPVQSADRRELSAKVEAAINEELALLLKKGVTADELVRARKGYLQQQEVGRSSDGNLTAILTDNVFAGRTMQYYVDLEKKINAQTPDSVLKALVKYVNPQRLVVIVAGDFAAKAAKTAVRPTQGAGEAKE